MELLQSYSCSLFVYFGFIITVKLIKSLQELDSIFVVTPRNALSSGIKFGHILHLKSNFKSNIFQAKCYFPVWC